MLLGPESHQHLGNPDPEGREPMQPHMAGGTEGDEQLGVVVARLPVMDDEPFG